MNLCAKFSKFLFLSDEQTLRRRTNLLYLASLRGKTPATQAMLYQEQQEPITRLLVRAKIGESYFDLPRQTDLKVKSKDDIKVIYSPNMLDSPNCKSLWNPTP